MKKIVSLNQLVKFLTQNRLFLGKKQSLVLATGCFDLLHLGHKNFLKAAKKQGCFLIVGLESDKRVRFLKGKNRPVNKWLKRAKKLAQLSWVDMVFPLPQTFVDPATHARLLDLIKPQVLAVSENTPHLQKKQQLAKKMKIKLYVFAFDDKYSTSKILNS